MLYLYSFSSPEVKKKTGLWWHRELAGAYFPTASLNSPALRMLLQRLRWIEVE
jgi:hypothetical protein